jgi:peptidoglycan-associated lipoprotein
MIKRMFLALTVAAVMAGCSSVKLDDVPVEDKGAASVTGQPGPGAGQSSVAPVVTDPAAGSIAGPANVARIIYFDYDSYVIKPEFQSLIEAHARFLKANNSRRVAVEGHTDERGGREYNLALGQRRAEAVRRSFGLLGVPDTQVEAVSFGKEKPAAPGSDEASWAQNRRAEIVYRR